MISRYMIKILSFDINNHISQMISTNPGLFKSLNSIKTRHITLRLIIFQICAFSVLIYIERNFCSDTTSVELYIILFKGNTIFSYCRDSSLFNTSFVISLFL